MIDKIVLPNILFLDIETVPENEVFSDLSEETQHLFADKTKYQRKDDFSPEEFYERAGIWAEFGKIVCISVGYFTIKNDIRQFRTTSFFGEEIKILRDFSNLLQNHFSSPATQLCGHNIKEFDLPFIARRMIINRLPIPDKINNMGKKPWEINHLDTLELWKFGDYKHYTSLKLLAHILQIPSPKDDIDGSQVAEVYYKDNNIDRIIIYCEKDVVTVAQIILRLKNMPLLDQSEIKSI
ncbi:MAG TPA: 3'-5' exonuclease [Flavobacterium sp.]|nr:3'-5' exonuclease [Flavobacterium sp.]